MMPMRTVIPALSLASALLAAGPAAAAPPADEQLRLAVGRGLDWLARTQARDGHWEAEGGGFPTAMTSLAGVALLMEGSTLREGKYADNLRRTTDWLLARCQPNGLIGRPTHPLEVRNYMHGHGYALLFLACVYGEEEDAARRQTLERVLTRAVEFCGKAQTSRGGWGYVSAADSGDFDEGSVTVTQLQALRAARNAGIVVPKSIIDKAMKYLKDSTTPRGGIIYSLALGGPAAGNERPPLTAAAVACAFSAGEYRSPLAREWLRYCQSAIPLDGDARQPHHEYMHYYYAQAVYILGEDRYAELFPEVRDPSRQLTWSRYRAATFDRLLRQQAKDGHWDGSYQGPLYATAVALTILQLETSALPIHQR